MSKSKILIDFVDKKVTLCTALERLLVISNDLDNTKLKNWVNYELSSYPDDSVVPNYRIITPQLLYSGINGQLRISDAPLDLSFLDEDHISFVTKPLDVRASINTVQLMLNSKQLFGQDVTYLAGDVAKHSSGMVLPTRIMLAVNVTQANNIIYSVRTRILSILLKLDKVYANLDNFDLPSNTNLDQVNTQVTNIITGNVVTSIDSSNTAKDMPRLINSAIESVKSLDTLNDSDKEKAIDFLSKLLDVYSQKSVDKSLVKKLVKGLSTMGNISTAVSSVVDLATHFI